jgi:ketosteroid isomerase-like protein
MSQTKDEATFRLIADAISSGDLAALQAASDPELEYTSRITAVEGKTYRGPSGWSDYLADLAAAFDDFRVTIEELTPVGDASFVAAVRVTAVARESGLTIDQLVHTAWSFRDGKAKRGRTFVTRDEAFDAMGVGEAGE